MAAADTYNPPSVNPADEQSLAGAFRAIGLKLAQNTDDCLPCIVKAVQGRTRVTVHPQVMMGTTGGDRVSRAQVASVPILNIGAGGFLLSFPVKAGDFGWLKASDRDISLFLQSLKEEWPNTKRMHSFQDGFFIPDIMRQWTLAGEDADRATLQNLDGTVKIALADDRVKMVAPLVEIHSPTVTISGDLNVAGHVTGNGIVLDTHTHTGGTISGDTGAPIP